MTSPLPNMRAALVIVKDKNGNEIGKGYLADPWNSFFQQFTQQAPAVAAVSPTSSPFSYQANQNGTLIVSGGTVSAISLTRGTVVIPLSTVRPLAIPISIGDTVTVTYSVLPTIQFLGAQ